MQVPTHHIYQGILKSSKSGKKLFMVLLDPDKSRLEKLEMIIDQSILHGVDYFLIGGSLLVKDVMEETINVIKHKCNIPVILFPGSTYQICDNADGLLFLSLISGRNAELLIGKHVESASMLKQSSLEIISTGYILIDGGKKSAVEYMSNTVPIPNDKNDIAMCTALAGEMIGMKLIYLEAGSGANQPVSTAMIKKVAKHVTVPLIVGGGITSPEKVDANFSAGANGVVIGNAIESNPELIGEVAIVVKKYNESLAITL